MSTTCVPSISLSFRSRASRWTRLLLPGLLFVVTVSLLFLGSLLFLTPTPPSFARAASFETCATVPPREKPTFCNGADPIQGGCASDAETVTEEPILDGSEQIGLAQMRHSPSCNTYWGRGFSFLSGKSMTVFIPELGTGGNASFLSTTPEIYSNMIYATIPTVTIGIIIGPTRVVLATIPGVNLRA
ncbi:DUF2690 domain-containing protein [Thermogemmatispora tikiterensis]|uniref:DUF2690 domain-containing protein n=1 Tax=Thermogemmatispora tikiterensis TaxID=1825093 RepID=A0A328VQT4_9CHLR|nr:DUF2690 domain-containing protein [Thermogemmatispora tikiterensis]RAQ98532.1 hypothetical protein A4R35_23530 [Thermogemmatispora tikiterensis]